MSLTPLLGLNNLNVFCNKRIVSHVEAVGGQLRQWMDALFDNEPPLLSACRTASARSHGLPPLAARPRQYNQQLQITYRGRSKLGTRTVRPSGGQRALRVGMPQDPRASLSPEGEDQVLTVEYVPSPRSNSGSKKCAFGWDCRQRRDACIAVLAMGTLVARERNPDLTVLQGYFAYKNPPPPRTAV